MAARAMGKVEPLTWVKTYLEDIVVKHMNNIIALKFVAEKEILGPYSPIHTLDGSRSMLRTSSPIWLMNE